ncbi:MAG TPA: hypothetical protein VGF44_04910 [Terriglobales bacterium]|jgi:hypothetical protein
MKLLLAMLLIFVGIPAMAQSSNTGLSVDQQNANKAKSLIDQAIKALGGDAYLNIQDVTQEGRTYSFHMGRSNSAGLEFWRFYKYPDKDRYELTKQRDIVELFNGDKAIEITYKGARRQDAKDVADYQRRHQYALDWVLRHWLTEPGIAFFYENQTVAEGKTVDQVTVMNADNDGVTLYFDVDTHLPVKKSFSWRDPTDKQRNVEEESYDNYRPTQGIMTPYTVTRYYNGDMSNQRFLTSVQYNQNLNDSLFDPTQSTLPKIKK